MELSHGLTFCGLTHCSTKRSFYGTSPIILRSLFSPEVMSLQKLDIVPRQLPGVRAGRKLHTIRWREREIAAGP